jgi:hypothetical protein
MLPFGYVAHGDAADPSSLLQTAVTVDAGGIVREIAVSWGASPAWRYAATYSGLGATPAPAAPPTAKTLRELRARR